MDTETPKIVLKRWQKFGLDTEAIVSLRTMLNLGDTEEFPEALWIIMGIHKAMECAFIAHPWGYRELVSMIIESQVILTTLRNGFGKFSAGEQVLVKRVNRQGNYWHPAPLGMHLVNCQGDLFVVKTEELEAVEAVEKPPFETRGTKKELASASA